MTCLQSERMNWHWWTDGQTRCNHTSPPFVPNTRTPSHPHHTRGTTYTHGCIFSWVLPRDSVPSEGSGPSSLSSFAWGSTLIVQKSDRLCCPDIFQEFSLSVPVMVLFIKLAELFRSKPFCFIAFVCVYIDKYRVKYTIYLKYDLLVYFWFFFVST